MFVKNAFSSLSNAEGSHQLNLISVPHTQHDSQVNSSENGQVPTSGEIF